MFDIGPYPFDNKTAARNAIRLVLNEAPIGQPLEGDKFLLIYHAIKSLHPDAAEKLARGCEAIVVRINHIDGCKPSRGFWIIGHDGTETDFSLYTLFLTEAQNQQRSQSCAARRAVEPTLRLYKDRWFADRFQVPCQISNRLMTWEQADVHHDGEWPFDRIFKAFIAQRGDVYPPLIEVKASNEVESVRIKIWTEADAANFRQFHDARASLLIVHRDVHQHLKKARAA
jgi:hypothetical protein